MISLITNPRPRLPEADFHLRDRPLRRTGRRAGDIRNPNFPSPLCGIFDFLTSHLPIFDQDSHDSHDSHCSTIKNLELRI